MIKVLIILISIILFHIICGTICICYFIGEMAWITLFEVLLFMLFSPLVLLMYWVSIIYYWIRHKFKKNAV